jgi:hypothetical protein
VKERAFKSRYDALPQAISRHSLQPVSSLHPWLAAANFRSLIPIPLFLQLPPSRPLDLPISAFKHRCTRAGTSIRRCDQLLHPVPRARSLHNPHNLIGSATEATFGFHRMARSLSPASCPRQCQSTLVDA